MIATFVTKARNWLMAALVAISPLFALQGGPVQPDYMQFEPSGMKDMVSLQTGNFAYSIPLGELPGPYGGYPLSLSYHAGISPQQEATWVGLGWTLSPGSINRDIRGVPDDQFHGGTLGYVYRYSAIQTWNLETSWTMGVVSVGQNVSSTGGVGFSATVGPRISGVAGVGFTVGTEAIGVEGTVGFKDAAGLNIGLMLSSNGIASARLGTSIGGRNVKVSAGVQYSTGSGAAYSVGFGDAHGVSNVGLSAGPSGISTSMKSGPISTGMSRNGSSVSVNGSGLSVSNASAKGGVRTSSAGFPIVVPTYVGVFSLGFGQALHEYHLRSATSDYVYGYMYQAGPSILSDGQNKIFGLPVAMASQGGSSGNIPWKWTMKGRTLESLGEDEMYPSYDMYTVSSEGVSGTFRPFTREEHRLHKIVSNEKTTSSEVFEDYSVLLKDSTDGWPYGSEFEEATGGSVLARSQNHDYESYRQCIHSDSCSPYALYSTRFRNEGNRLVFRKNTESDDTLTTGMNFLFVGEGGYYESEPFEGAKSRERRNVSDILLKRKIDSYDYALYGSRKIEPILEDNSPVGKLKGFVITNSDGTRYYFEQPVRSYLKVDYSINQEKGTPIFVDLKGDASDDFLDSLVSAVRSFLDWSVEMVNPSQAVENTLNYVFKKGSLDEKCKSGYESENNALFYTYQVNMNPYATQWLLTEIRGADFIQLGDSVGDNVGYNVKFHYTEPSIYRWRTPFARPGLDASDLPNFRMPRNGYTPEGCDSRMYQAGFGVKEYVYLKSIETSTHRAEFELNDPATEERVDGKGWDFNYNDKSKTMPMVVQASILSRASVVSEESASLPTGNGYQQAFTKQKISIVPEYLYTNMKLPERLLRKFRGNAAIKVTGMPSVNAPTMSFMVQDSVLYQMPSEITFAVDSVGQFEESPADEYGYGLYRLRIRLVGDSIYAYRYAKSNSDMDKYNHATVVFGENGNYVSHPLINWSDLVFAGDSSDPAENQMRYLKKISYFNRGDSTPYREFEFGYDYSLHPKALNSYCKGRYPADNGQVETSPDYAGLGICESQNSGNHLYGKLSLKSITETDCQYGKCSSLPGFKFEYHSPSLTSTRLSTKNSWMNLSQNLTYASPEDTVGTNQFPDSYYENITDLDASIIASSNVVDDWGFWNERANPENHKVWQDFADYGASAWSLSRVTEPAGGIVEIDYERDVYKDGEENSNENMYAEFESADYCKNFAGDYSVAESDSSRICLELSPLYWREQCLGPRSAFWDVVRPAGYRGTGFEYLDTMGITTSGEVDTSRNVLYNVLGNMGTKVKCGFGGLGKCSRTRSVAVLGDAKPLKLLSKNDGSARRLLVLDRSMHYMDAALQVAADKINSSKNRGIKSKQGSFWVRNSMSEMKGGDLRVRRLIRHDIGRTVTTEYTYEPGEIAQLPDSAYNTVIGNRFYSGKVSFALPDMDLSPKSRIVGFGDNDLFYVPGSNITYPKVTVKNYGAGISNGRTEYEYVTPETGIPADFIDEDTRSALQPFLRVNTRIFVWGGYEDDRTYKERPFLVAFTLLDANKHALGETRKMMVVRDGVTSFTFYDENIRNARYLAATSRFSMDSSLSVQHDTLALNASLSDFNDMDVSVIWFLGTYTKTYNKQGMKDEIRDDQNFVLHKSWLRSQKEGYYPIIYKAVEYGQDSITLQEMDANSGAEKDGRDVADFESSVAYHDFTAFLGLNTKISFYRGGSSALMVRQDSTAYSTRVPDIAPGVAEGAENTQKNKIGRQVERWSYERVLKCKDGKKDKNCEKQYIALYDKDSRKDSKSFRYIRYPAFQVSSVSYTGHDNQPSSHIGLWGKSALENHQFDPLTGLPTATLAKAPSPDGKEMRKLTLKKPHYSVVDGDTSLANGMFRRNMLSQNYLSALYSGTVPATSPWNSIQVNDSLRSFDIAPYRQMPDSVYPGKKRPYVGWGNFRSRREPREIVGGGNLLSAVSPFQSTDPAHGQSFPTVTDYDGEMIGFVDWHFRVRESRDGFGRTTATHYSHDGMYETGLFFPAGLSEVASFVPHRDTIAMANCGINSLGYGVTENELVLFDGFSQISCYAVPKQGRTLIAEYTLRKSGRAWETVRDTVSGNPYVLTLYGGYLLSYLRIYPADAQSRTFVYDRYGNMVRFVSEDNVSTYYEYDPFGHLVQVRDDDGNSFKAHHREYRNGGQN